MTRRRLLWIALSLSAAFSVLTIPILLRHNWPGEWAIVCLMEHIRIPTLTTAMQLVTFSGSAVVGLGVAMGSSVATLWYAHRPTRRALLPVAAILGAAPLNLGLRAACGRLRPGVTFVSNYLPEVSHPFQRWAYPSGHAMTAVVAYGAMAFLLAAEFPRCRWAVWTAWAAWLAMVGLSRVYLGVHWPTDVLGGYLIGGAWLSLCVAWLGKER